MLLILKQNKKVYFSVTQTLTFLLSVKAEALPQAELQVTSVPACSLPFLQFNIYVS